MEDSRQEHLHENFVAGPDVATPVARRSPATDPSRLLPTPLEILESMENPEGSPWPWTCSYSPLELSDLHVPTPESLQRVRKAIQQSSDDDSDQHRLSLFPFEDLQHGNPGISGSPLQESLQSSDGGFSTPMPSHLPPTAKKIYANKERTTPKAASRSEDSLAYSPSAISQVSAWQDAGREEPSRRVGRSAEPPLRRLNERTPSPPATHNGYLPSTLKIMSPFFMAPAEVPPWDTSDTTAGRCRRLSMTVDASDGGATPVPVGGSFPRALSFPSPSIAPAPPADETAEGPSTPIQGDKRGEAAQRQRTPVEDPSVAWSSAVRLLANRYVDTPGDASGPVQETQDAGMRTPRIRGRASMPPGLAVTFMPTKSGGDQSTTTFPPLEVTPLQTPSGVSEATTLKEYKEETKQPAVNDDEKTKNQANRNAHEASSICTGESSARPPGEKRRSATFRDALQRRPKASSILAAAEQQCIIRQMPQRRDAAPDSEAVTPRRRCRPAPAGPRRETRGGTVAQSKLSLPSPWDDVEKRTLLEGVSKLKLLGYSLPEIAVEGSKISLSAIGSVLHTIAFDLAEVNRERQELRREKMQRESLQRERDSLQSELAEMKSHRQPERQPAPLRETKDTSTAAERRQEPTEDNSTAKAAPATTGDLGGKKEPSIDSLRKEIQAAEKIIESQRTEIRALTDRISGLEKQVRLKKEEETVLRKRAAQTVTAAERRLTQRAGGVLSSLAAVSGFDLPPSLGTALGVSTDPGKAEKETKEGKLMPVLEIAEVYEQRMSRLLKDHKSLRGSYEAMNSRLTTMQEELMSQRLASLMGIEAGEYEKRAVPAVIEDTQKPLENESTEKLEKSINANTTSPSDAIVKEFAGVLCLPGTASAVDCVLRIKQWRGTLEMIWDYDTFRSAVCALIPESRCQSLVQRMPFIANFPRKHAELRQSPHCAEDRTMLSFLERLTKQQRLVDDALRIYQKDTGWPKQASDFLDMFYRQQEEIRKVHALLVAQSEGDAAEESLLQVAQSLCQRSSRQRAVLSALRRAVGVNEDTEIISHLLKELDEAQATYRSHRTNRGDEESAGEMMSKSQRTARDVMSKSQLSAREVMSKSQGVLEKNARVPKDGCYSAELREANSGSAKRFRKSSRSLSNGKLGREEAGRPVAPALSRLLDRRRNRTKKLLEG